MLSRRSIANSSYVGASEQQEVFLPLNEEGRVSSPGQENLSSRRRSQLMREVIGRGAGRPEFPLAREISPHHCRRRDPHIELRAVLEE